MSHIDSTVTRYLEVFNEPEADRRLVLIDALCTDDYAYTDPLAAVRGKAAFSELVGVVQKQFPNVTFVAAGPAEAHHDVARFRWNAMAPGSTEPLAVGFDVVTLADGRIRTVVGFLDKAPG